MTASELVRAARNIAAKAGAMEAWSELYAAALLLAEENISLRQALDAAVPLLVEGQTALEESCSRLDSQGAIIPGTIEDEDEQALKPFRNAIALAYSAQVKRIPI